MLDSKCVGLNWDYTVLCFERIMKPLPYVKNAIVLCTL